jgi:hypothetical protein
LFLLIHAFEGELGNGKTLLMSFKVLQRWLSFRRRGIKCKVLANYGLKIPHEKVTVERLLFMMKSGEDLQNCIIALDELQVLLDSRNSISDVNQLLSYFFLQSRKQNVYVYFTTQFLDQVEKRVRRIVDTVTSCVRVTEKGIRPVWFHFKVVDKYGRKIAEFFMEGDQVFRVYDTRETITDFQTHNRGRRKQGVK